MAGTSLNRMLLDLTKTTPKAQTMMDQLGISIYDQSGAMLPLVDIIGQFEGALGDATAAERDAALQAIFTAQGQRAMNTLLSEGVAGWQDMAAATDAAAGIQEQAAIRAETYAGKMEALEGTIETLKIEVGMALLPILQDLADWFMQMIDQYGPQIVAAFEWIAEIIKQLIPQFFALIDFLANQLPGATTRLQEIWAEVWPVLQELAQVFVQWFQDNLPLIIETGQVMLLYLDIAYERWKKEGKLVDLGKLREAIYHGAVQRVRPKAMTVGALLFGLLPIMWSTGSGADTMKRIAVPMIGGIVTSFALELIVYPVIYFLWRGRGMAQTANSRASRASIGGSE